MKKMLLVSLSLIFLGVVFAEKAVSLPTLHNPSEIVIDGKEMVIADYPKVYIYAMSDYTLKKAFGERGQGPGEFYIYDGAQDRKIKGLVTTILPDMLIVNSCGLLSFFSRDGQYKKSIKNDFYRGGAMVHPTGKS
jgi:hypothetical protein